MNTFYIIRTLSIAIVIVNIIGQASVLAKETPVPSPHLLGYPEATSPTVWIPKKDIDAVKRLLESEIQTYKPPRATDITDLKGEKLMSLPFSPHFNSYSQALSFAISHTNTLVQQDNKDPELIVSSNDWVMNLVRTLNYLAQQCLIESNVTQAKKWLKAAILITKDTGRNTVELEKYQRDYTDLFKKTSKQQNKEQDN
jgi:hypothetical protein